MVSLSSRPTLVICGLRDALRGEADHYASVTFSPESISPFVARAAAARTYRGRPIEADEIEELMRKK